MTYIPYLTWGHFFFSQQPSVALARNTMNMRADVYRRVLVPGIQTSQ